MIMPREWSVTRRKRIDSVRTIADVRTDGWEWDETLYAGSAGYYSVGRMPYPPQIAETLRDELGLDGRGRLLDIGCGPGSLTLLLAPLFAGTVGVDADAGMIAEAARRADQAGIGTIRWERSRAEDIPVGWGPFQVVTFAQSIHWIDQAAVLPVVRAMLAPGGVCVHVQATTHRGIPEPGPLPRPAPPHDAIAELVASYLGEVRRAGRGTLPSGTPGTERDELLAAGFSGPTRIQLGAGQLVTRTEDEVVAAVFSLSYAAPHLFGGRLADFERDLRGLLRRTSADGLFSERPEPVSLDLWRP
jgi:SAM-dependent methyltransferase